MNTESSIYIPRMSTKWTEDGVRNIMQVFRIGTVSRVDFTPINKKPGFGENVDQVVMSAFVHFSDPYINTDGHYLFRFEMYMGNTEFWEAIESGETWKLQVLDSEYWLCLKNNNPVQRTMTNSHPLQENECHLERIVTEQAEEIKMLKETVGGLQETVYQLLGGLYCQRTQGGILNHHIKTIGLRDTGKRLENDTHSEKHWPTTRQGDAHEKRIRVLEQLISNSPCTKNREEEEPQDTELYQQRHSLMVQQKRRIDALEERLNNLENDLIDYGVL